MLNGGNAEYRVSLSKCTLGRILSSPDAGKRKECSTFTREKSEKEGSGEIERRAKSRSTVVMETSLLFSGSGRVGL